MHHLAWQRVTAGAVAGLMAQTAIYPLDVVRRRMQTHEGSGAAYRSPLHALRTIAREEGVRRGLYRGLTLNYLKTMCAAARSSRAPAILTREPTPRLFERIGRRPNVAIYMSLYDIIKIRLQRATSC